MTRGELLERMDSRELTEWLLFSSLEPIGDRRADLRAAQSDALLASVNRDPTKHKESFSPKDFLVYVDPDEQEPEPTEEEKAEALATKMLAMLVPDADNDDPPDLISSVRGG